MLHAGNELLEFVGFEPQPLLELCGREHRHGRLGAESGIVGMVLGDEDLEVAAPERVDHPVEAFAGARGFGEQDEVEVAGDVAEVCLDEGGEAIPALSVTFR